MNKNAALMQEWKIFKAICPESIITKIKGENTDYKEYYNIAIAVLFLGFSEICDEMLENAPLEFKEEKNVQNKSCGLTLNIEKIDSICSAFIKEIKSCNMQRLFEFSKSFHDREYYLYQNSKKSIS